MSEFPQAILESVAAKICVIAAPGSGKTRRVIIPKARQILADTEVDPKEVLLLTFSRPSAIDLRHLVKTMDRAPTATTVHSYCLSFLLSEDNHDIRARIDTILLDFEKDAMISDLKLIFPTKHRTNELEKDLEAFSSAWAVYPHDTIFEEDEYRQRFKYAVVNWLHEYKAVLMEEIAYFAVDLARKLDYPDFLGKAKYVFVDEYQDLNQLEQEFINVLGKHTKLLIIVGDPDQSIYSFKHAYPDGILALAENPDYEPHKCMITSRCGKKIVEVAKELLMQSDPARVSYIESSLDAPEGELTFAEAYKQTDEFKFVLNGVRDSLEHVPAAEIIVLVPRWDLGNDFAVYAERKKGEFTIDDNIHFECISKPKFSDEEQQRILQLGLLVKRDASAHIRSYLGIGDSRHFAQEVVLIKDKYGPLDVAVETASMNAWPGNKTRVRKLCKRLIELREFLGRFQPTDSARSVIGAVIPADRFPRLRAIFDKLMEEGEHTAASLFKAFEDSIRITPAPPTTIKIMTLMASKGLQAEHVYIIGCNAGNIPGQNRSTHLSDAEHKAEQRRLLYVGFTRAKQSLTVTWSRHIPLGQAKRQHTAHVGIRNHGRGNIVGQLGLCEFLQDLPGITWQK